ncbi:MAG: hypothetical protein CVU39_12260 [Chloroflexi bacterium HGW-Chloroflexi-10]|nr:MAG: hypothetical protein CVU39_12260 [Chloroflexi bacterium HGW-Chloroflexi-10]
MLYIFAFSHKPEGLMSKWRSALCALRQLAGSRDWEVGVFVSIGLLPSPKDVQDNVAMSWGQESFWSKALGALRNGIKKSNRNE